MSTASQVARRGERSRPSPTQPLNRESRIALRSGNSMPVLGLGSWMLTSHTAESVQHAIEHSAPRTWATSTGSTKISRRSRSSNTFDQDAHMKPILKFTLSATLIVGLAMLFVEASRRERRPSGISETLENEDRASELPAATADVLLLDDSVAPGAPL